MDTLAVFYQPGFLYQQMGDGLRSHIQTLNFTKACCGGGISSTKQTHGERKCSPPSLELCAFRMELAPCSPELGVGSSSNSACKVWAFLVHKYTAGCML